MISRKPIAWTCDSYAHSPTNQSSTGKEIFEFFKKNGFVLSSIRPFPSLRSGPTRRSGRLTQKNTANCSCLLLDKSLENIGTVEVMNINDLCRCVFTEEGASAQTWIAWGAPLLSDLTGAFTHVIVLLDVRNGLWGMSGTTLLLTTSCSLEPGRRYDGILSIRGYSMQRLLFTSGYYRGGCPYNAIAPSWRIP